MTQYSEGGYEMAYQTVFKRYELKYIVTREQKARILAAMEPYMMSDQYGRSTIRNIYFDTDDYILARHSIAKPDFKEKLRIRSYSKADADSTVFVELKRKYDHVVYKRRVAMSESDSMAWTAGHKETEETGQMSDEINYFLSYYRELHPAVFLSYEREAYKMKPSEASGTDADFRVTFDENILFRDHDIALSADVYGTPLMEDGKVLMELKCSGGIPLWMVHVLSSSRPEVCYNTSCNILLIKEESIQ